MSIREHRLFDRSPDHADDMTGSNSRRLSDAFGDRFDWQQKLRDQSALGRSELGTLIFVQGEQGLVALDLYSMDAVDRRCGEYERFGHYNFWNFPASHNCKAPSSRDYQSGNLGTGTRIRSHANLAGLRFSNSALLLRSDTARHERTVLDWGICA